MHFKYLLLCLALFSLKIPSQPAIVPEIDNNNLMDNNECEDLKRHCANLNPFDNISVLECVQSLTWSKTALPTKCQHAIWEQIKNYMSPLWLEEHVLPKQCPGQEDKLKSCLNAVDVWNCIHERAQKLDNSCHNYINRLMGIFYIDHNQFEDFLGACGTFVEKLQCGRLSTIKTISQSQTAQCLKEHGGYDDTCKLAISRIEQLSADVEFLQICSTDLRRFCEETQSGIQEAFKCLVKTKGQLSSQCAALVSQRDREIARDYRVSHGLAKSCKDDIKLHHCRRGVAEDKQVRLAQILLCLESVSKNGTQLAEECSLEINDHRRMLMQDYQLSPELLGDCAEDIPKFCQNLIKQQPKGNGIADLGGAEIIHCLMDHARNKRRKDRRITAQCQRSLESLIKVSDAGEDWRVDPILRKACKPVVDKACSDTEGGDARVMSCLMERIGTSIMPRDCEQSLLLIQYFVARDFKLDPQLYKHCRTDAIKYCRAKHEWDDVNDAQQDPERGPLILPCLHRIAYNDDNNLSSNEPKVSLRKDCFKEVKRVMRQRAVSVDLIPEVEDYCIDDLAIFCFDKTEKGAEMECLQTNLEKLQEECKNAVTKYTEEEAGHIELNPVIMSVCNEAMQTHCSDILNDENDKGGMMDCLISHKNDADLRQDLKCRAAIEHFQIISLKNYHFTYKFKEACRPYVSRYCTSSTTKNEVVACLSEVMRNDTIKGQRHTIPKECRQQVKAQLYQQHESLTLDPKLANACKKEIEKFCKNENEPGQAIECLTKNTARLGNACHHAIFLLKKTELGDSATDYTLVNTCKEMTYKFCSNNDPTNLLECLKLHKDDPQFDPRCHLVVVNRMIEQNTDFRFNPSLQLACGKNIDRYCSNIVAKAQPNEELNGKVIQCLKDKFRESKLDEQCQKEMVKILQEQALNYRLNPLLQNFCKSEIEILCKDNLNANGNEEDNGLVEECLKQAFLNQKIINRDCKVEVATLIAESKADIHVDPILEEACTQDLLRYCSSVRSGNGRKLKCLQVVMQDQSKAMVADCRKKMQKRIEMFRNADTVLYLPPENMQQLVNQVVSSPAKKLFFVILISVVGIIFLLGIVLGRVTKRALNVKNK